MELTRRDLTAAGAFALAAATPIASTAAAPAEEEAVSQAVEALRKAVFDKDKAALEKLTAEQLSYGHSSAVIQNKTEMINGVMGRKAALNSLDYPDLKVIMVGNNAIARHRYVSDSELDGKANHIDIGILEVWTKEDGGWKLLARQGYKLPEKA
ncbi:MAG: nuclear transport factor 2 family protein [Alphaproteobacteria bacterium]|nr:nuclear transport factor 2 family protein [Alphaproteobacteria bacterium]